MISIGGVKRIFAGLLKKPAFWIIVSLLTIGGGTYFYLRHSTNQQIETAVAGSQANATIDAYQTEREVHEGEQAIDDRYDNLARQTQQEYRNVRTIIQQAPAEQRQAPVPPLIIDTLNALDRVRPASPVSVSDSEVPVG